MNSLILNEHLKINWIDFYVLLGNLSQSLREKNVTKINDNLINCIHDVLCFARQNNIDMDSSWTRWQSKMEYKNYF